jgi:hypothetical protein
VSVGVMAAECTVAQAVVGLLAARGVFDLHPSWAVLAFVASIDGLLCLSDPLAKTRHPRPQAHSRTSTHGSPSALGAPTASRLRPRSRAVCSTLLDRRASHFVVSVIGLRG